MKLTERDAFATESADVIHLSFLTLSRAGGALLVFLAGGAVVAPRSGSSRSDVAPDAESPVGESFFSVNGSVNGRTRGFPRRICRSSRSAAAFRSRSAFSCSSNRRCSLTLPPLRGGAVGDRGGASRLPSSPSSSIFCALGDTMARLGSVLLMRPSE